MFGRLYQLGKQESIKRATELLEQFRLTDAATALQEMCVSLGATQSQLSDQLKHLRNSGLLNHFDEPMIEAVSKLISWSGGVRSQIGDSHRVNDTSTEDTRFF